MDLPSMYHDNPPRLDLPGCVRCSSGTPPQLPAALCRMSGYEPCCRRKRAIMKDQTLFGFRDSGFGFRDSRLGIRDSGFGFRDSGFGIRFAFWDSNFGIWVSEFDFQVSGFGSRVSGSSPWTSSGAERYLSSPSSLGSVQYAKISPCT